MVGILVLMDGFSSNPFIAGVSKVLPVATSGTPGLFIRLICECLHAQGAGVEVGRTVCRQECMHAPPPSCMHAGVRVCLHACVQACRQVCRCVCRWMGAQVGRWECVCGQECMHTHAFSS